MRSASLTSHTPRVSPFTLVILLVLLVATPLTAQVTLICPSDITASNDPGVCSAVVNFPEPSVTGTGATDVVTITPPSGSTFPVGSNTVDVVVTDAATNVLASCSFTITVLDSEPPAITNVSVSKQMLWPPNHKLVNVTVNYTATNNCGPAAQSELTVTSNEPANATGSGHTAVDWQVVDAHHVRLRAERSGNGNGRVYTITITATDAAGNSSSTNTTVFVPHDRGQGGGVPGGDGGGSGDTGHGHGHGHGRGP